MSYFKIGARYLAKRKLRTALTMVAILLGVSIFLGTAVASDSIQYSLNYQVSEQFGYSDIIIIDANHPYQNSLSLSKLQAELDQIKDVDFEWTYQMRQNRRVTPYHNISTSFADIWQFIAFNASDPTESKFGSVIINSTINTTLTTIEELLTYPVVGNSCVITQYVAEYRNLTVGQHLYVYPHKLWPGVKASNSSTWLNLTITGIIEDTGKSFSYFWPPITDTWEIRPPEYAVYVHIDTAQKYIFNQYPDEINLVLIHAKNFKAIDTTINLILNAFNTSSDPEINATNFYAFNLKSFFADQISSMFTFFTAALALFSGIALLICAILIKNLFEVTKEEQIREIGVMRAIGISKLGIFKIYLTQISIITIVGTIFGIGFGFLTSYLFIGPLRTISLAMNADMFSFFNSNFQVFMIITPFSLIFALGIGIGIGMVFGMIPAVSAANVNVLKAINPRLMEEKA
ncbi:MAG: ABC transporter permease [Candidatus Helarchaeota archaeon]